MKKQIFSLLALLCLTTTFSSAQFLNYYANFGNSHYKMTFSCVVPTNCSGGRNVYAIGTVDSTIPSRNKYIYVAEIDPNGSIVWDKQYRIKVKQNQINNVYDCISAMETSDGYLVIAGNVLVPFQYKSNGFVLKIKACASSKNIVWFQQCNQNTFFTRIVEKSTSPAKYYVSGQDMQVGNPATAEDGLLMEIDPATGIMTMVSNRTVSGSDTWSGLVYDQVNNAFYVGGRYNYNSGNTMMRQSITKLSSTFNEVWTYPYVKNISTDQARLYLYDLNLSNSNLYAVGAGDVTAQNGALTQQFIKTDLNGTLQAGKQYTITAGGPGTLHQIIPIPGSSDFIILGDLSDRVAGTYGNAYLMRVDAGGNIVWANQYPFTLNDYVSSSIRISGMTIQGGSLYAVGQYIPSSGIPQAALLKVDPADGCIQCAVKLPITASSISYQGPLTSMSPESFVYTGIKITSKKLDLVLDWNNVCSGCNPCGSLIANAGPNGSVGGCCAITLNGSASGGNPAYTYSWSPTAGLSNPNIANPTCTIPATYTLTVTDAVGCTATDVVVITSGFTCCKLGSGPNPVEDVLVTPNPSSSDFTIQAGSNEISKLTVFNAVGQLVETDNNFSGTFKFGGQLPEGVYIVNVMYVNGKSSHVRVVKITSGK